jgi:hypothetical protein
MFYKQFNKLTWKRSDPSVAMKTTKIHEDYIPGLEDFIWDNERLTYVETNE